MKKIWIYIVIILVIAGGIYLYAQKVAKAPTQEENPQTQQNSAYGQPTATPTAPTPTKPASATASPTPATHFSSGAEGEGAGPSIQVYEVDFTGQGFAPAKSNLNVGDYIFFKNTSTANFLPADKAYAGFGPATAVTPGKEYKFQFTQAGTWTITNQLDPSQTSTVVVSK